MIDKFVKQWEANKKSVEAFFKENHPEDYAKIVKLVVFSINPSEEYGMPDPSRIHEIDDGYYQGTLLYVIAETGYQPSTYWAVSVDYGSCSGCDTLESIRSYDTDKPTEDQVKEYMALATHIVQGLVEIPNPMYPTL